MSALKESRILLKWNLANKKIVAYCCKAEQCFKVLKGGLNPEAPEYFPEDGVEFFDVETMYNSLVKEDNKYWDDLYANKLISESVAEFSLN